MFFLYFFLKCGHAFDWYNKAMRGSALLRSKPVCDGVVAIAGHACAWNTADVIKIYTHAYGRCVRLFYAATREAEQYNRFFVSSTEVLSVFIAARAFAQYMALSVSSAVGTLLLSPYRQVVHVCRALNLNDIVLWFIHHRYNFRNLRSGNDAMCGRQIDINRAYECVCVCLRIPAARMHSLEFNVPNVYAYQT